MPSSSSTASNSIMAAAPLTGPAAPFVALAGFIGGLFGAHHAAAVKNEAAGMNQAIPAVRQSFDAVMEQVNNGTLTVEQANQQLDSIWPQYENLVYNTFKIKKKDCNGPCVFEKQLKQDAENIKALLASGHGGSVTISAISPGRGYQSFPSYILTYNGPNSIGGTLQGLLGLDAILGTPSGGSSASILGGSSSRLILFLGGAFIVLFFAVTYGKR